MLVLSRKRSQRILIGSDVVVTLLQVNGGTVKVGIEAPKDLRILRGELDVHEVMDGSTDGPDNGVIATGGIEPPACESAA